MIDDFVVIVACLQQFAPINEARVFDRPSSQLAL